MQLSYDEFMSLVPKETKEFVINLLENCAEREITKVEIYINHLSTSPIKVESQDYFLCEVMFMLYETYEDKLFSEGTYKFKIYQSNLTYKLYRKPIQSYYDNNIACFQVYKNREGYRTLMPLELIAFIMKTIYEAHKFSAEAYGRIIYQSALIVLKLIEDKNIIYVKKGKKSNKKEDIADNDPDRLSYIMDEKIKGEKTLTKQYFLHYEENLKKYLSAVARIFFYLRDQENLKGKFTESNYIKELKTLSSLLALYFIPYDYGKPIRDVLENDGITLESLKKSFPLGSGFDFFIYNAKLEIKILLEYFSDYNSEYGSPNLADIFKNLVVNNSESEVFKILKKSVKVFEKALDAAYEDEQKNENSVFKDIFKNTDINCVEFINTAVKVFKYLQKNEANINKIFVKNDSDRIALAFLITFYLKNDLIARYFSSKGIKLNDIERVFNIEIDPSLINQEEVDQKILRRYFYENYAQSTSLEDLYKNVVNRNYFFDRFYYNFCHEQLNKPLYEEALTYDNSERSNNFFKDLPLEMHHFLNVATVYYKNIKSLDNDLSDSDISQISLLLAGLAKETVISNYLKHLGISSAYIFDFWEISESEIKLASPDIDIIENNFGKYIYGGNNKDKNHSLIDIDSVLENIFTFKDFNSFEISRLLASKELSYDSLSNIRAQAFEARDFLKKNKIMNSYNDLLMNRTELLDFLNYISKIYLYLKEFGNKELLKESKDIEEISIVIAMLLKREPEASFCNHQGLTIKGILRILKIDNIDLNKINAIPVNEEIVVNIANRYGVFDDSNMNKSHLIRRTFSEGSNSSKVLEIIMGYLHLNYESLRLEVIDGKFVKRKVSKEQLLQEFKDEDIQTLDVTDFVSISEFGITLTNHYKTILDDTDKLQREDTAALSVTSIDSLVNQLYPKQVKKSFFGRLFGKKVVEPSINLSIISDIASSIDEKLGVLRTELSNYDYIRQYIEIYLIRVNYYYTQALNGLEKAKGLLDGASMDSDTDYLQFNNNRTLVAILSEKVKSFEKNKVLIRTVLAQVHQAIINHFVTINALQISKDNLLPIIKSQLLISEGINSEGQALDISKEVVEMLHSLLTRNVEGASAILERLRESEMPQSTVLKLEQDVSDYFTSVETYSVSTSDDLKLSLTNTKKTNE